MFIVHCVRRFVMAEWSDVLADR